MAHGRTDLPQYAHACETLLNMIPSTAGGAHRRPGTIQQDQRLFTDYDAPVLFPFVAANGDEFIIECLPMRDGGVTGSITAVTSQDETEAEVFAQSSTYTVTILNRSLAAANFVWTREDLLSAKYIQIGDILYIVTANQAPLRIVMNDPLPAVQFVAYIHHDFQTLGGVSISTGEQIRDAWPYVAQNLTAATFSASAITGLGITVTMSDSVFHTNDVGSLIKIDIGGTYGCVRITSAPTPSGPPGFVVTPQTFTADVIVNLGGLGPTASWWAPAWSDYRGWPATIEFYRSRLGYGGNTLLPDSIWWSETSDYFQLSKDSITDPDSTPTGVQPFTLTLAAGQRAQIKWMKAAKSLLVGTAQSEWLVDSADTGTVFGGDNKSALRQSEYGSNGVIAYTGNEVFFVSRDGSLLRSLAFSYYDQSYIADEVHNLYSDFPYAPPYPGYLVSQTTRAIIQIVWDESRQTLWCIDNSGNWRGLTRSKKTNINAWHSHQIGGYDSTVVPDLADVDPGYPIAQLVCEGSIVSIAVISDVLTRRANLWLVVRRRVNNIWVWSLETMRGSQVQPTTVHAQILAGQVIFTDCSVVLQASVAATDYTPALLEGKVLRGTANNVANGMFALKEGTVTGGLVLDADMDWGSLPNYPGPADDKYWFAFGLPFSSVVRPVRVEAGSIIGSAQGAMKRITKVFTRFFRTLSAKVGSDENRMEEVQFRLGSTPMADSAELFTGDKEILLEADYDRDGYVRIAQDEPLPFSVVSIAAEGVTYD